MRILAISDIDDYHWKYGGGQADLVVSCGDVSEQVIREAAEAYSAQKIFAVKGNHDTNVCFHDPIVDLHLRVEEYGDLKFGGLNGSWKYKPRGHFLYEEWEVGQFLSSFPPVDVFVSHNSPRGIHDREDEVHYGFEALKSYIQGAKPNILIHGHQHVNHEMKLDETKIIAVFGYKLIEI
jgi:Icc-related predicted phosphoesterase